MAGVSFPPSALLPYPRKNTGNAPASDATPAGTSARRILPGFSNPFGSTSRLNASFPGNEGSAPPSST